MLSRAVLARYRRTIFIFIAAVLSTGFALTRLPEVLAKDSDETKLYDELKVFADVLSIVQQDYVREVDNKKVVEGAIKGMLTTLDPHSGYLDPDFYKDLQVQTKGEFGGLGIEITIKEGLLVVVSPMEGSPAEQAGIRAGDTIVKIDGKFTKEFSLVDAVKRMRGPKGSPIILSVTRKGSPDLLDFKVVRDNIQVRSVKSRSLGEGFGYVRISQFMEKTSDDLRAALRRLVEKNGGELKGLVLDLRNNPGGLLNQAVSVSDTFLTDGVIVYTDGRSDSQRHKFYAHARDTEPNYPMIVLVNGGSASASEIVAGAMQDAARAIVLGTQTFGKGSVQTITPLNNGGALTLTTALYYTKSGRSIQVTGVKPDIELDVPADTDLEAAMKLEEAKAKSSPLKVREGDLPGAIDNPQGSKRSDDDPNLMRKLNSIPVMNPEFTPIDPERTELGDWLRRDAQMSRALELLKTFNVFKSPIAVASSATSAQ